MFFTISVTIVKIAAADVQMQVHRFAKLAQTTVFDWVDLLAPRDRCDGGFKIARQRIEH